MEIREQHQQKKREEQPQKGRERKRGWRKNWQFILQFISREERYTLPYRMGKLNFFTLASRLALLCNKDPFSRKKTFMSVIVSLSCICPASYCTYYLLFFFCPFSFTTIITQNQLQAETITLFSLFSLYHDMLLFCSPSSVSLQVSQTLFLSPL